MIPILEKSLAPRLLAWYISSRSLFFRSEFCEVTLIRRHIVGVPRWNLYQKAKMFQCIHEREVGCKPA